MFFVHFLVNKSWIKQEGGIWGMTMEGWEYLSGPAGPGFVEGRCFVTMSFSAEHDAIYTDGIRPALMDAG
jgi:hypothetical protein